jgi:hypothetical protein
MSDVIDNERRRDTYMDETRRAQEYRELRHFGVKGMRWGVRKSTSEKAEKWQSKKDARAEKWATKKANKTGRFGGEATLNRYDKRNEKYDKILAKKKYAKAFAKRDERFAMEVAREAAKDPSWDPQNMTRAQANYIRKRAGDKVAAKEMSKVLAKKTAVNAVVSAMADKKMSDISNAPGDPNEKTAKVVAVQAGSAFGKLFAGSALAANNSRVVKAIRYDEVKTENTNRANLLREKLAARG